MPQIIKISYYACTPSKSRLIPQPVWPNYFSMFGHLKQFKSQKIRPKLVEQSTVPQKICRTFIKFYQRERERKCNTPKDGKDFLNFAESGHTVQRSDKGKTNNNKFTRNQCNQIWRNFATLAKSLKSWANFCWLIYYFAKVLGKCLFI